MMIDFKTEPEAQAFVASAGVSYPISQITETAPPPNIEALVDQKIESYQMMAPKLLRALYAANTVAGISTAQSDIMVDDYQDVILRIREGLFPTALFRLQMKRPSGFVTQAILDAWRDKILAYL
jgi:hypothetical protein